MKAMDQSFAATQHSCTVRRLNETLLRHALAESARELSTMVSELRARLTGKASSSSPSPSPQVSASAAEPPRSTPGRGSPSVADGSSSSSDSDGGTPGSSTSSFRRRYRTLHRRSGRSSRYSRSFTQSELLLLMETGNKPRGL